MTITVGVTYIITGCPEERSSIKTMTGIASAIRPSVGSSSCEKVSPFAIGRHLGAMTPGQRDLFKQAVFRFVPLPSDWPTDFAIITAYDPDGLPTSPELNLAADAALEADLRAAGYRLHRITGGSADGVHLEPGWGVPIGLPGAVELGRRYRQVAVFYVRAGALTLVDCEDGSAEDLGLDFRAV
jgi:hypothetical protein